MSLILDALNRADQERSARQSTPTIQTVHRAAHSRQRHWRWERAAVAAMVVGVAVYFLYERVISLDTAGSFSSSESAVVVMPSEPGEVAPNEVALNEVALNVEVARNVEVGAVDAAKPVSEASTVKTHSAISKDADSRRRVLAAAFAESDLAPFGAAASDDEEPASDRAEEVNRLYRTPPPPPEAARRTKEAEAILTAQVARASRSTSAHRSQGGLSDVPYIADLPMQLRREIPSLNYSEHMPGDQAGAARVRLNGQVMREGQLVAPELELVTIDEQGIILRFREVPFRLPVLNRWVNF